MDQDGPEVAGDALTRVSSAVVTGGAGFIGSHIVDELIGRGIETTVIDNFSSGSEQNLSAHSNNGLLRVVSGDVSNINSLLSSIDRVDVVFHEAAIASVPKSIEDPLLVHETNVSASLKVMNYCVQKGVKRMVFASSAAVYGAIEGQRASEEMLCSPSSPYGASKLAVEGYLSSFRNSYGLETVALRYFNVFGPRQGLNEYSGVITVFANGLLNGTTPTIFGDGTQTRDFVHVKDIVNANILAMTGASADGQVFNVASGTSTSILSLFETLRRVVGTEAIPTFAAPRPGDVRSGSASISKIRSMLGFEPSVSLEHGLASVVSTLGRPRDALKLAP
jgi:nucleoside-diphosphate-sugar epimerase